MIRQATQKDLEDIYNINQQLVLSFTDIKSASKGYIQNRIEDNDVWVFELGEVIGDLILDKLTFSNSISINSLAVKQKYHRIGIGESLLKYAIDKFSKSEYNKIIVGTMKEYNAVDFYLKNGFTKTHTYLNYCKDSKAHLSYVLSLSI